MAVGTASCYTFQRNKVELLCHDSIVAPVARSGHRIVHSLDNHYIYVYGGFSDSHTLSNYRLFNRNWTKTRPLFQELWCFSKLTKTWEWIKTIGSSPREVASHCMAMLDHNTLLVYGGTRYPFGRIKSNKIYTCDLKMKRWHRIKYASDSELPSPQYGQAILLDRDNGYLYVCGGTNGQIFSLELHRFHFETRKWKRLYRDFDDEMLGPRYRHEIALWRNKIYVVGGANLSTAYSHARVPVFDLEKEQWTLEQASPYEGAQGVRSYPAPRYSHEGGQLANRMYICGGTDGMTALQDIWHLDLDKLSWHKQEHIHLPHPIYFHSASISTEGEMVLFGGVTSIQPKIRTNALYSIWLNLTSLANMSLNATLYRIRHQMKQMPPPIHADKQLITLVQDEDDDDEEDDDDDDFEEDSTFAAAAATDEGGRMETFPVGWVNIETKLLPIRFEHIVNFFIEHKAAAIIYSIFYNHNFKLTFPTFKRLLPQQDPAAGSSSSKRHRFRQHLL